MVSSVQRAIAERLQNVEYRREYGAINTKYDLAFALVEARRRQGLTQNELASCTGVSQAYIAKLESGEANPTIGHIGAMLAMIWLRPKIVVVPLVQAGYPGVSPSSQEASPSPYEDSVIDRLGTIQATAFSSDVPFYFGTGPDPKGTAVGGYTREITKEYAEAFGR